MNNVLKRSFSALFVVNSQLHILRGHWRIQVVRNTYLLLDSIYLNLMHISEKNNGQNNRLLSDKFLDLPQECSINYFEDFKRYKGIVT